MCNNFPLPLSIYNDISAKMTQEHLEEISYEDVLQKISESYFYKKLKEKIDICPEYIIQDIIRSSLKDDLYGAIFDDTLVFARKSGDKTSLHQVSFEKNNLII